MGEIVLWIIRAWLLTILGLLYGWGLGFLCCPRRMLALLFRLQGGSKLENQKTWKEMEEHFSKRGFLRLRIMGLITLLSTSFVVLMWARMGIFDALF
ncbi:hypothetical protein HRbin08_02242 [bacterium HR08]|nr:hypothetical protein HRbin08_02242 [bacterium HR08]